MSQLKWLTHLKNEQVLVDRVLMRVLERRVGTNRMQLQQLLWDCSSLLIVKRSLGRAVELAMSCLLGKIFLRAQGILHFLS